MPPPLLPADCPALSHMCLIACFCSQISHKTKGQGGYLNLLLAEWLRDATKTKILLWILLLFLSTLKATSTFKNSGPYWECLDTLLHFCYNNSLTWCWTVRGRTFHLYLLMLGKKKGEKKKRNKKVLLLFCLYRASQTDKPTISKLLPSFFKLETTSFLKAFDLRRRYISFSLLNGIYRVQPE